MKSKDDPVAEMKKNVSKKLFAGQERRKVTDDPTKKKDLNKRLVNTSGSFDFSDAAQRPRLMKKSYMKKRIEKPKVEKKDSVFNELGKIPLTDRKIVGNATEMIPDQKLKVDKKNQYRVNKILGK
jgi:hypothetical protein